MPGLLLRVLVQRVEADEIFPIFLLGWSPVHLRDLTEVGVTLVHLDLPVSLPSTEVGNRGNRIGELQLLVPRSPLPAVNAVEEVGPLPVLSLVVEHRIEASELVRLVVILLATMLVRAALSLILARLLVGESLGLGVVLQLLTALSEHRLD